MKPSEVHALPRHPLVAVLDHVRSAYNVGAILRTADAALLSRVYLCGITPPGDHREVRKTALGAEETVPWQAEPEVLALLHRLRAAGYTLAALELTDRPTPFEAITPAQAPLALVVGNEVEGVQQAVLDLCDIALEIPQFGAKQSLNVSVAFGVAAYALLPRLRR